MAGVSAAETAQVLPAEAALTHSDEELAIEVRGSAPSSRAKQAAKRLTKLALLLAGTAAAAIAATSGPRAATAPLAVPAQEIVVLAAAAKDAKKEAAPKKEKKPECRPEHADDSPSLFCWAVMFEGDKELLKSQFDGRVGIFACNDYLVIGEEEMSLGKDDCGVERLSMKQDLPAVKKGMYGVDGSMTSSWLNVPIFLTCWDVVIESNKVWEQDFTVKVDPDTVFLPDRLGGLLKAHKGKPIYTTDCRFWGGDDVGQLFGSIEVVSKQGIGAYSGGKQTCKDLDWQGWGEDYWLQHCMDAIGVPLVLIADQVTDGTCPEGGYADCGDSKFVALHPYKDAGAWWDCWKSTTGQ